MYKDNMLTCCRPADILPTKDPPPRCRPRCCPPPPWAASPPPWPRCPASPTQPACTRCTGRGCDRGPVPPPPRASTLQTLLLSPPYLLHLQLQLQLPPPSLRHRCQDAQPGAETGRLIRCRHQIKWTLEFSKLVTEDSCRVKYCKHFRTPLKQDRNIFFWMLKRVRVRSLVITICFIKHTYLISNRQSKFCYEKYMLIAIH